MKEVKIQRALNHKNIVGFQHFFEDDYNLYMILELCQNNSLRKLLKRRMRLEEVEV